jgi:predicted GNAT family acetyltransferase
MRVERFHDRDVFAARVEPFLLEHEAENCFFLGLISHLRDVGDKVLLATMDDADDVAAVAVMTPRRHMVITRGPQDAIAAIVDYLIEHRIDVPGIGGRQASAEAFAQRWATKTGVAGHLHVEMRTFQLTAVIPPGPAPGKMRLVEESDLHLLTQWVQEFRKEIGEQLPIDDSREVAEQRIRDRQMVFWEVDGTPVGTAGAIGPTRNGIRIVLVYTPPEHRGRGYASNLVAALSQQQLDAGRKFCFLNTDEANPTSNKIYIALGYRPVCETIQIMFDRPGDAR